MRHCSLLLFLGTSALVALGVGAGAPAAIASDASAIQIPASDEGLPGAGPLRREDWFQQLWLTRRSGWAQSAAREQGSLVFLGDSITQGWDAGSIFPGVKTANRGISGDTTRGVLVRLADDVIALHPRAVVLLIGTNDIELQADPATIAGNVKLILAALKQSNPGLPVVLCDVFPSAAVKQRPMAKIKQLNALYAELVKDQPQVTLLDTWSLFADVHGDALPDEFPDLLHPNNVGYARWAAALRPILEELGVVDAWPDDFNVEPGFVRLFDGVDLTGWHYAAGAAFDGLTRSPDGRYLAKDGRLIVTVARPGRTILELDTTATFPRDFVLKLEFRASPNADSGIFIRGPQLQCRDFIIAGPYSNLRHYRPLDWNEIVVTVKGRLAHATCNGEVIADAMPVPADGPIGLESDRGQMEYRRIRLSEAAP